MLLENFWTDLTNDLVTAVDTGIFRTHFVENETISFRGHASAIIRSGYKAGKAVLTVTAPDMEKVQLQIEIIV